jgi:hypothetical protein
MASPAPLPPPVAVLLGTAGEDEILPLKLLTRSRATLAALRASLINVLRTSPEGFGCVGAGAFVDAADI